jgi:hypothetical protein
MVYIYGGLCIVGTLLPFSQFIPWLTEHGLQIPLLLAEASVSKISAFAWLDVVVSAIALVALIVSEGRHVKMPGLWLPLLATFSVGVSLGLPLFLLLRELHLQRHADDLHPAAPTQIPD